MNSPISKHPHLPRPDARTVVKGLFTARPIQYEKRLSDGKTWADFFGKYEQQKWGFFDSNSCWALGGAINELEDQLELLAALGMFPPEAMKFFNDSGILDADGDFSLSEQFIEILGKRRIAGGWSETAWQLIQQYGCIGRSMLNYSEARVEMFGFDEQAIEDDYFNLSKVTPQMRALGQKFLQYVNIAYQRVGTAWQTPERQILKAFLKMAPLAIGIPIPVDVSLWNNQYVKYDGGKQVAHEVELFHIYDPNDPTSKQLALRLFGAGIVQTLVGGEYFIFDQYEPHLKILSPDYYIIYCTMGVAYPTPQVIPNPVPQNQFTNSIWSAIGNFFNNSWKSFKFSS